MGQIDTEKVTWKGLSCLFGGMMGNQKRDPRGVGIDKDGAVWSVNYFSSSVTKLDAKTLAVVGEIKVGANPDSYGDFTGTPLMAIAAANGDYTYIFSPSGGKLGQKSSGKASLSPQTLPTEHPYNCNGVVQLTPPITQNALGQNWSTCCPTSCRTSCRSMVASLMVGCSP